MNKPDILLIAPPESRRVRAFQASAQALGWPAARVVSYLDLLHGRAHLPELVQPGSIVRFESSGEDIPTERALIELGGGQCLQDLAAGEVAPLRAWYAGFSQLLRQLEADLRQAPSHQRMQQVDHILTMFDKPATHQRLRTAGVPVPEALPEIHSSDELLIQAQQRGWNRVFVKLAYGSSASGTVALQWSGQRVSALSTVQLEKGRLYNSRRLVPYTSWVDIHRLIDALAPQRLHVEQWWPKASLNGRTMDLRVVVIGGQAQHTLVRLADGPITNLHLGNERGDLELLIQQLGRERWQAIRHTAEAALNAFPGALYGGVDLLLTPSLNKTAVLEVNAFGDYHRGVLVSGLDTYGAELKAICGAR